jgi:hypothetical protein
MVFLQKIGYSHYFPLGQNDTCENFGGFSQKKLGKGQEYRGWFWEIQHFRNFFDKTAEFLPLDCLVT